MSYQNYIVYFCEEYVHTEKILDLVGMMKFGFVTTWMISDMINDQSEYSLRSYYI